VVAVEPLLEFMAVLMAVQVDQVAVVKAHIIQPLELLELQILAVAVVLEVIQLPKVLVVQVDRV
jgi:hypothetical protein